MPEDKYMRTLDGLEVKIPSTALNVYEIQRKYSSSRRVDLTGPSLALDLITCGDLPNSAAEASISFKAEGIVRRKTGNRLLSMGYTICAIDDLCDDECLGLGNEGIRQLLKLSGEGLITGLDLTKLMETPQILDSIFRKVKTVIELEIERGNETATVQYESMNDTVSRIYCEWWDLFRGRLEERYLLLLCRIAPEYKGALRMPSQVLEGRISTKELIHEVNNGLVDEISRHLRS